MTDQLEVIPGAGTVIRFGSISVWVGPAASPALVSFLIHSARNLGSSPLGGQQIADHVAGVLRTRDPEPSSPFVTIGPSPPGLAALLHGPVQLWDGARWLSPSPNPGWIQGPLGSRSPLIAAPGGASSPRLLPDSPYNLLSGVVPGGGFSLTPDTQFTGSTAIADEHPPEPAATEDLGTVASTTPMGGGEPPSAGNEEGPQQGPPSAGHEEDPPREPGPPGSVDLRHLDRPAGPPLPPSGAVPPAVPGQPVVRGIRCPRGHFNHPGVSTCVRCGATVDERTAVTGQRPALGVLIRDDGSVFVLDAAYVIGGDPARDPTVTGGLARPLRLDPPPEGQPTEGQPTEGQPTGAQLEIRLSDWDVTLIDRGSGTDTFVFGPGDREWTRLTPYQARTIRPGTHIACGPRVLTFASPWPG